MTCRLVLQEAADTERAAMAAGGGEGGAISSAHWLPPEGQARMSSYSKSAHQGDIQGI